MDNLDNAVKIVGDKVLVEMDKDCVMLLMNTKRPQYRVIATEKNNLYIRLFDMFVWLMSESEVAMNIMPSIILAWRLDTGDDELNIKGTKGERKMTPISTPSGSLADNLFKKVLGGK